MLKTGMITAVILLTGLFLSCDIINPPEDIPSYVKVDTVMLKVTNIDQGAARHNITCVKVNIGGTTLGFFELPALAPTLITGLQGLYLEPGIELNGIAGSREVYPFFEPYTGTGKIDFAPGEVITILPQTSYKKECKFAWMEAFEDAGLSFEYPGYSDTVFRTQTINIRDGRASGAIYLDSGHKFFEAYCRTDFTLPKTGSKVLLEFDYISEAPLEVGLYLIEDQSAVWNSLMIIRPIDHWNRIYIDLHTTLDNNNTTELFRPAFRTAWDSTNLVPQKILMDNIKLIHF